MLGPVLLILTATLTGLALRAFGAWCDRRRGDTLISDAIATGGVSLVATRKRGGDGDA